jgi:hypothetical protein
MHAITSAARKRCAHAAHIGIISPHIQSDLQLAYKPAHAHARFAPT